jgi:hypothetical protein
VVEPVIVGRDMLLQRLRKPGDPHRPLTYELYLRARRARAQALGDALKSTFANASRQVRRRSRARDGNRRCRKEPESAMHDALECLASLHPAYHFGRLAHHRSEEQESRHLHGRREHAIEGSEPAGMVGELAAAVAMFAVLLAVLVVIAGVTIDAPDTRQEAAVAIPDPAETR